ncbi:MAG: hypothetical protein ACSLE9_17890 [Burkholderiaceae bacterium]
MNALVSLAGTIAGGLVGYFSSRRISDRSARAAAVAKLRSAFAPTLAKLSILNGSDLAEIGAFLNEALGGHAAAIEEFRPFARKGGRPYEQAWNEYKAEFGVFSLGQGDPSKWMIKAIHKYRTVEAFFASVRSKTEALLVAAES